MNGYPQNFSPDEFNCKCRGRLCEGPSPHSAETRHLAWTLQRIRDELCAPVRINSGYRCPAWNKAVGGSSQSFHVKGMAADLDVDGVPPSRVAEVVEELMESGEIPNGGLGRYDSFTHVDIRNEPARWQG